MEIKPIKTEADYEQALHRVEELWDAPKGSPQGDELDILATLIDAYESNHYPIDLPDPIEAIRFRLDQQGQDFRSLIGIIGQRTRVYEVMRGARPLSLSMIRNLHDKLGIPAEVLIQPVRKKSLGRKRRIAGISRKTRRATARTSG
jgi:HTH-type transcriptional regulator / antitoxin HigA